MKSFHLSMAGFVFAAAVAPAAQQSTGPAATYEDFTRAIRANDLTALSKLLGSPGAADCENKLHARPLHYAAIYGSSEAERMLLKAGADTEARNQQGATPLLYAAWDAARTKQLVDKGARVNAPANDGTTPLMVAASAFGNSAGVLCLLEHGADIKATDRFGDDALIRAAGMSDSRITEVLLARGADPHQADKAGFTALQMAQNFPDRARVDLLLKAGADVNSFNTFAGIVKNGPIALRHLTPLGLAASYANTDTIAALLKAGARVNEPDSRKMNPLMLAIATDQASPAIVKQLIAAGADVNAKDQFGDSVLDWSRKFNNPSIVSAVEGAGARGQKVIAPPQPPANSQAADAAAALARTIPLLAKAGSQFFREGGGCSGCHHQPIGARVHGAALDRGVHTDESLRVSFDNAMLAERPVYLAGLPLLKALPGDCDRILAALMALADLHAPANEFTDAALHYLAIRQDPSGTWRATIARPPIEDSPISRTAMAIRALRIYGWPARRTEFESRIDRARLWLKEAQPVTTYEEADRITGLRAAGFSVEDLQEDTAILLAKQRQDGGWAQTPYLKSDSYGTGVTLHSLYTAGLLTADSPAYDKGVAFLVRTQFPDGSWYVRSRAPKFQPYFQSGFPFDHDQWISAMGTGWAAIALAHAAHAPAGAMQSGSYF